MPPIRKKELRSGFTTGACAAAAAKGAALMLAQQQLVNEVTIDLPTGISATFQLQGQTFDNNSAFCFVIKDAGDDPDVTNGAELHARVTLASPSLTGGDICITGGIGIGKVTKPGLAVAPGDWAINPVPRRMIEEAVREVFPLSSAPFTLHVAISIPDGEERAKRTLNARLGILGGLSILGTTGIVKPISTKAWTDTIDSSLDVARACGCRMVVLSTGRTSELAAQQYLEFPPTLTLPRQGEGDIFLPEEAFVMMGDHLAYAVNACQERQFDKVFIACQFAKLLKIACGHANTHAAASELDLAALHKWSSSERLPAQLLATIAPANTAREIILACDFNSGLLELVAARAKEAAHRVAGSLPVEFLVADYHGKIIFRN